MEVVLNLKTDLLKKVMRLVVMVLAHSDAVTVALDTFGFMLIWK